MPNDIKKLDDGSFEVKLETGEVFKGDPMAVTEAMAKAHVETKRWGQEWKTKAETPPVVPPPVTPPTPQAAEEAQLQNYLLEQQAKALGFPNAEAYKQKLASVVNTSEEFSNQVIAANFLNTCQDFPNTPEAIEQLSQKIEQNGWDFSPQSMIAAHSVLVREHSMDATKGYAPLTAEQINSQWAASMQQSSRQAPPPMLRGGNPETGQPNTNDPYAMDLNKLRSEAIRQNLGR